MRTQSDFTALRLAQEQDPHLKYVLIALKKPHSKPFGWWQYPLRSYTQLWSHLVLVDGVAYRQYMPGPCEDVIVVLLIPLALRGDSLHSCHSAPGAGHQGVVKTLARMRQETFWASMKKYVEVFCKNCVVCRWPNF